MRLSATKALIERPDAIIVATVSAIYGLGDPESYFNMVLHLSRGERIDQRTILRRLAEMQYKRNELDLAQGNYRVRGDVIDIFPAESERDAVRVELFDDEIESLAYFDPLTGARTQRVERASNGVTRMGALALGNMPRYRMTLTIPRRPARIAISLKRSASPAS